jgi:hypothetical protein
VSRRSQAEAAWWAGYERGAQSGHALGYREGATVLDEAAAALAAAKPSRTLDVAAARQRLAERPAQGPAALRAQAYRSWGLPVPSGLSGNQESRSTEVSGAAGGRAETAAVERPEPELTQDGLGLG